MLIACLAGEDGVKVFARQASNDELVLDNRAHERAKVRAVRRVEVLVLTRGILAAHLRRVIDHRVVEVPKDARRWTSCEDEPESGRELGSRSSSRTRERARPECI